MMNVYELKPTTRQKSFYGKALVIVLDDGTRLLKSYDTIVLKRKPDGELVRTWQSWSATTGKHIAAFAGINKKEYLALPLEMV